MEKRPAALKLVSALAQAISDKKGENILALDVRGVCSMTDYFLIAEGTSPPPPQGPQKGCDGSP